MIFKRALARIRAQDWAAVAIEFLLVVIGVFIAIVAANWNEQRLERQETSRLLVQYRAELARFADYCDEMVGYYRITDKYAERADAGWRNDRSISDREFVIAAYQASQVTAVNNNAAIWAQIFGADELRDIEDQRLREQLAQLLTFDFNIISLGAVSTRYREEVRKTIPNSIQASIRTRCGDRLIPGTAINRLPQTCDIPISADDARSTAAELRSRSELQRELRWHQAAVANQVYNIQTLKTLTQNVAKAVTQE